MRTRAPTTTALCVLELAASLALVSCVRAQVTRGGSSYAQTVLRDVVRRHPEVKGLEIAARRNGGCVTVVATDAGDIGDRCDGAEQRTLRNGELHVEEPSRSDPVYMITEPLHDPSGAIVGLVISDISPDGGRDVALARARTIRQEIESRIRNAAQLTVGVAVPQPGPEVSYEPRLPSTFVSAVTNPYFPLTPGTTLRFRGTGKARDETNVVTVTNETRVVNGIRATVVHDQVFRNGELAEDTYDWYAQDAQGNVWYLGEETKELRNGRVVGTQGSWEAGVGGGKPGVIMWGDPAAHVGETYRQEYLRGVAEDMGKIVSLREVVLVPYGRFEACIKTEDTTPLEPNVREYKYYCRGVGVVKEGESAGEGSELVTVERR